MNLIISGIADIKFAAVLIVKAYINGTEFKNVVLSGSAIIPSKPNSYLVVNYSTQFHFSTSSINQILVV